MALRMLGRRSKLPPYERKVYQVLAVLRFFFFAAAVALTLVVPPLPPPEIHPYLLAALVGVYTLARVIYHLPVWSSGLVTQIIIWGDLVVCISVVLLTGGLGSAFLLYSLLPVISAALLSQQGIALAFASLSPLALLVAHLVLSQFTPTFAWVLEDNNLARLSLYVGSSALVILIGYRANINVRRRVEIEAALGERRRLRRELHDGMAQNLGFLKMKTSLMADSASRGKQVPVESLREIEQAAESCYHDLRESLDMLASPNEGFSLVPALASYVQNWSRRSGIRVQLIQPPSPPVLHPVTGVELLRIAQGALSNIQRHSGARQAWVELKNTSKVLSLVIRDDGRGLSPLQEWGHGLSIMEERAQGIGGTLSISSVPGEGTAITVTIPTGK